MENKQTVVEWIEEKMLSNPLSFNWKVVFEQAKQIEKEHIMMAYNDGRINQGLKQNKNAEQYYNETYGK